MFLYWNTYCILLVSFTFLDYFVFNCQFISILATTSYSCEENTIFSFEPLPMGNN